MIGLIAVLVFSFVLIVLFVRTIYNLLTDRQTSKNYASQVNSDRGHWDNLRYRGK